MKPQIGFFVLGEPIHNDPWPQFNYQSSSTCIFECGTPSLSFFFYLFIYLFFIQLSYFGLPTIIITGYSNYLGHTVDGYSESSLSFSVLVFLMKKQRSLDNWNIF